MTNLRPPASTTAPGAQRAELDRDVVADAALKLLDEVGLDGLTVRRLAARLGVQNPALYWHFRNKQELLDLMAQHLQMPQEAPPPGDGETWDTWIAARAHARHRLLLSRRDGARLIAGTSPGPEIAALAEADLRVLVGFGFDPVHAMRAIIAIGHYVTGFTLEEQAAQSRRSEGAPPAPRHGKRRGTQDAALESALAPLLMEAIQRGGPPESPEAFEQGLTMLIDGMRALPRHPGEKSMFTTAPPQEEP
ncbi:TetR/AcrR family transcriptional regulator C-terminal domain-containing protein [Streptomyces reniochalinae]|uniref:TetR family transcriptional regulator n=1 Tax=Streptomyces reniochalinae TaxID=2250578 RepID=A0A367F497_9ACTN|nr:TetR/AcrR family transcriptional regulator C-terminal domain-containing protein [Streptomyces reniochalinae]RCG25186.1 TetR family transcriptional regulator [Streptomyces reniochalinae]